MDIGKKIIPRWWISGKGRLINDKIFLVLTYFRLISNKYVYTLRFPHVFITKYGFLFRRLFQAFLVKLRKRNVSMSIRRTWGCPGLWARVAQSRWPLTIRWLPLSSIKIYNFLTKLFMSQFCADCSRPTLRAIILFQKHKSFCPVVVTNDWHDFVVIFFPQLTMELLTGKMEKYEKSW